MPASAVSSLTLLLQTVLPHHLFCPVHLSPKEPIQQDTSVTGFTRTGFTSVSDIKSLGLGQSFEVILFVLHAVCISVETFQVWYFLDDTSGSRLRYPISAHSLKRCHFILLLIIGKPGIFPFPVPSSVKELCYSCAGTLFLL